MLANVGHDVARNSGGTLHTDDSTLPVCAYSLLTFPRRPCQWPSLTAAFIVYDITRRSSFEHVIDRWLVQLRTHTHQSIVLCLLGNKSDQAANREVRAQAAV